MHIQFCHSNLFLYINSHVFLLLLLFGAVTRTGPFYLQSLLKNQRNAWISQSPYLRYISFYVPYTMDFLLVGIGGF